MMVELASGLLIGAILALFILIFKGDRDWET